MVWPRSPGQFSASAGARGAGPGGGIGGGAWLPSSISRGSAPAAATARRDACAAVSFPEARNVALQRTTQASTSRGSPATQASASTSAPCRWPSR